jgi:hypothetical protein
VFAHDLRGLLFEAFATHRGFLGPRTLAFELPEQVRVVAVRTLDAALHGVALALRRGELLAPAGERHFGFADAVFAAHELDAQMLETLLAFEDARMRIATAVHAQPVAPDPLARAGDHRFVVREIAAQRERLVQRLREAHVRQQANDGARAAHHAGQHVVIRIRIDVAARLQQRDAADGQRRQHLRDLVDLIDAQRF